MRLKRLDIHGYKSFATHTSFEFSDGLTAIIGPNGSGKSNVADAIRWVLGEQSYRSLRAQSTEDMIFSGSRQRARLGMAEVVLTLDNTTGWLPIDYTEVTVGRRAYRSGENEYLLNNARVRYRDILDLLDGAGLVRSNYAVIGQGMVDAALALRPEARRGLFEEAAGIAPHLRKRTDALRRIQEAEQNLVRVGDILNELRPRATDLRRQAERAEEHQLLRQDLIELQRIWFGYQWQYRQRRLARAETQVEERRARLEAQRVYARDVDQVLERLASDQAHQRESLERISALEAESRAVNERARRDLAVLTERGRLYQQQRAALSSEIEALSAQVRVLTDEIARLTAEMTEQESSHAESLVDLERARGQADRNAATRAAIEGELGADEARLDEVIRSLSDLGARSTEGAERRAELSRAHASEVASQQLAQQRSITLQVVHARAEQDERGLTEELQGIATRQTACAAQMAAGRERWTASESVLLRAQVRHDQLVARHELLDRARQELTGYLPGVREALRREAGLTGLLGTVASLIQVPADVEGAIESALGARLQNIVAERWEDAEAAIAHLKRTRAGWATFVPLDAIHARAPIRAPTDPGVVGVASALVGCEPRLRTAVDLLLGNVVVVRDLDVARRLLRERSGASLYVTLGGETVQPSGVLSGGTRRQDGNLLVQEREWRDLPQAISAAERELASAEQARAQAHRQLADLQSEGQELDGVLARLQKARDAVQQEKVDHAQALREVGHERDWHAGRAAQIAKELASLATRDQEITRKLAVAQDQERSLIQTATICRDKLAALDDESLQREVAELGTRVAVAERTLRSQRDLLASHRRSLDQLESRIFDKRTQWGRLAEELQTLAVTTQSTQALLDEQEARIATLVEQAQPLRDGLMHRESERRGTEDQRSEALARLREAELDHSRAELERDRCRDDVVALTREVESDLGPVDLPEDTPHQLRLSLGDDTIELPMVDSLPAGLGDEIREVKARLRRIGNTNPDAPHEYEHLLDRQTFLQSQVADLRGALASLHEVIDDLDEVIERDFGVAVRTTDGYFREYFGKLFRGGSASLVLTEPDSLGTTGVDIVAHPPGKRAQNLSLLSGGERALTAVALLFALLRANPVPFCFLDEVDAALDEANVARFRELLEEHAASTQFVVITHNRKTIEAASTIYGISMGEQGVSQCISLKLEERAREVDQVLSEAPTGS